MVRYKGQRIRQTVISELIANSELKKKTRTHMNKKKKNESIRKLLLGNTEKQNGENTTK